MNTIDYLKTINSLVGYLNCPVLLFFSGDCISFDEATALLRRELRYPPEKAARFVQKFDTNKDGRLSRSEFENFKSKLEDT